MDGLFLATALLGTQIVLTKRMDYYSIWPFFACMSLLLAFAATPFLAAADTPPSPRQNRLAALDGLRGFLALAVVFHHASIYYRFLLDGRWELPSASPFYALLGQAGVAMFFMVTGYLFWSRLIEEAGRPAWLRLYIGRLFRIGPLYLAAVAGLLVVVFVGTQGHLNVPLSSLARQVSRWLALGFLSGPNVNNYPGTNLVLAGVTWTLRYEWIFYLCLPAAAFVARRRRTHLPFTLAGLTSCLLWVTTHPSPPEAASDVICAAMFLTGMTCASLQRYVGNIPLPDKATSAAVLALLVSIFVVFSTAFAAAPIILLGAAFYLITSGCTVFGLLTCRPARRLGDISYGIYLLQGLALAVVFRPGPLRAIALASPAYHWLLVLLCMLLLIVAATAAHVLVERPGIALGRRVAALFERGEQPSAKLRQQA